jgi:hypothetical protein
VRGDTSAPNPRAEVVARGDHVAVVSNSIRLRCEKVSAMRHGSRFKLIAGLLPLLSWLGGGVRAADTSEAAAPHSEVVTNPFVTPATATRQTNEQDSAPKRLQVNQSEKKRTEFVIRETDNAMPENVQRTTRLGNPFAKNESDSTTEPTFQSKPTTKSVLSPIGPRRATAAEPRKINIPKAKALETTRTSLMDSDENEVADSRNSLAIEPAPLLEESADDALTELDAINTDDVQLASASEPLATPIRAAGVEVATFNGIQPGVSSRDDLRQQWGAPKEIQKVDSGFDLIYKIEPFDQVRVRVVDNRVIAIVVGLSRPLSPETLIKQLELGAGHGVEVRGSQGQVIGMAIPERGVMFGYASGTAAGQVAQVMIEPINAETFLHRAESNWRLHPTETLKDLQLVLESIPNNARALVVKAKLLLMLGRLDEAAGVAEHLAAGRLRQREHGLLQAQIALAADDFPTALTLAKRIAEDRTAAPILRARAEAIWGHSLALSTTADFSTAMQHHQLAMQIAQSVAKSDEVESQNGAREVLYDAALGAAHDISWGRWQQKDKVVPQWVHRAQQIAEDLIARGAAENDLELEFAERALVAWSGNPAAPDATKLIALAKRTGEQLLAESDDPLRKQVIAWRLGLALASAVEIEAGRNQLDSAQQYGRMAEEMLDAGTAVSLQYPEHDLILGRLYYRLGVIEAVGRKSHSKGIAYYDRAIPLLESPPAPSAANDSNRLGEWFVSMAVSYWQVGTQREALRLTKQGARLIEKGVEEGKAERTALAVPYSNLAKICEDLGQPGQAQQYADLAEHFRRSERK